MPPPLDLTRRRFGRLVVLGPGPMVSWGRMMRAWVCRCDCGAVIEVPQNRLPHRASIPPSHRIESCPDCRARSCEVCGAPVPPSSTAATCSATCREERARQYQRDYVRGRRASDPEYRDRLRQRAAARYRALDAEQRRQVNRDRRAREIAALGRDGINARARTEHAARMDDPEHREKRRTKAARWRQEHLDQVRLTQRDYGRRQRARAAAQEIATIHDAIGAHHDEHDD